MSITIERDVAPILSTAQSWAQLHERLAAAGYRYERQGSGATIVPTPYTAQQVQDD